jgi:hypothetical protein
MTTTRGPGPADAAGTAILLAAAAGRRPGTRFTVRTGPMPGTIARMPPDPS